MKMFHCRPSHSPSTSKRLLQEYMVRQARREGRAGTIKSKTMKKLEVKFIKQNLPLLKDDI